MNDVPMMAAISNIGCGLLCILISIPLVLRKIPMNHWYGFRIPKAFRSDENWYLINAYGGKMLIRWSVVLIAVGIGVLFVPLGTLDGPAALAILVSPLMLFGLIPIIQTLLYARKL
jgi:hypothetical protein